MEAEKRIYLCADDRSWREQERRKQKACGEEKEKKSKRIMQGEKIETVLNFREF